jgi:hypothetical protein
VGKNTERKIASDSVVLHFIEEGWKAISRKEDKTKVRDGGFEYSENLHAVQGNFSAALSTAKKFGVSKKAAESIMRRYLKEAESVPGLFRSVSLPSSAFMVCFLEFGVSRGLIDRFAKDCAKHGERNILVETAKLLGRHPDEVEIDLLIDDYCHGASKYEPAETAIIEMARMSLGENKAKKIKEGIAKRNREFDSHCD